MLRQARHRELRGCCVLSSWFQTGLSMPPVKFVKPQRPGFCLDLPCGGLSGGAGLGGARGSPAALCLGWPVASWQCLVWFHVTGPQGRARSRSRHHTQASPTPKKHQRTLGDHCKFITNNPGGHEVIKSLLMASFSGPRQMINSFSFGVACGLMFGVFFWGWVCPDCSNQSVSSLVRIKATRDDSDEANEAPKK